jgi:hypothetical protein
MNLSSIQQAEESAKTQSTHTVEARMFLYAKKDQRGAPRIEDQSVAFMCGVRVCAGVKLIF